MSKLKRLTVAPSKRSLVKSGPALSVKPGLTSQGWRPKAETDYRYFEEVRIYHPGYKPFSVWFELVEGN